MTAKPQGLVARVRIALSALLFPERCAFCGAVVRPGTGRICDDCGKALPKVEGELCKTCGREKRYCRCRSRSFQFARCVSPLYYEGAARRGILRMKLGRKRDGAAVFAALAVPVIRREYEAIAFDCVIPVPMSRREMRKRGFNQSELFAAGIAEELGIPLMACLEKTAETRPQRSCSGTERWGNVFGVFGVTQDLTGKNVLLTDDVLTTGATLNECARMLRLAGADSVYGAVIACVKPQKNLPKNNRQFYPEKPGKQCQGDDDSQIL